MNKRPLIGITPNFLTENNSTSCNLGYIDGINNAGGIALLLPLTSNEAIIWEILNHFDGFLLSGGNDIDAKYFNEPNYNCNGEINPTRDIMEIFIARNAAAAKKPVLGICRGCQVLNVAFGGSLYQDIHSQIPDRALFKHSQQAPEWYPVHDISVLKESRLWECYRQETMRVNSFHHQAVKDTGKGLKAVAWSLDGIVEAVEHEEYPFVIGVQWHPERMWQKDENVLQLFKAFIAAAKDERDIYAG